MPIDKTSIVAAAPPAKIKAQSAATVKSTAKMGAREEAVNGLGQIGQAILIGVGWHADAGTVGLHWPNTSREVAKLAESQPMIARLVDPLIQVGPYAALVAVVLPMVMQFGVNHGKVSPGAMGTVSKEHMESKVKTHLAQMELAMLREQQEAEQEAAKMKRALEDAREAGI